MSGHGWGAPRPVVLCTAFGLTAFLAAFAGALLLGRGLAGALAALLVPLALSGAAALGLAVAFVVAVVVEQPNGAARLRRLLAVVVPFAVVVGLVAYATEPTTEPFPSYSPPPVAIAPGPRSVPPVRVVPAQPAQPAQPARVKAVKVTVAAPAPAAPTVVRVAAPAPARPVRHYRAAKVSPLRVAGWRPLPASGCPGRHRARGRIRRGLPPPSCKGH